MAVFVSGKLFWAKVIGKPAFNKFKDANEWSFELEPDAKGLKTLKEQGISDRLKDKHEDRGPYLTLRKGEFTKDGKPNAPIRIYDEEDGEWPQERLIGNGSLADVKIDIRDYGVGKKKGVYPAAIRVTELVTYQSNEFGAMDKAEGKAPAKKAPKVEAGFDGLNDAVDEVL